MTWEMKKAQSIAILDRYKDEISQEAYERILWMIGTQAIEDIFPDERDIEDMIRIEKGEIDADALVAAYKREWGVL